MTLNEIRQRAEKEKKSIVLPTTIDEIKKEFIYFENQSENQRAIVRTYLSFDNEDKKSFLLNYKVAINNKEFLEQQVKQDSFYNCPICHNTLYTHSIEFYNDHCGHYFHNVKTSCKCNLTRKSLRLMEKNGLLNLIKIKSFDNFFVKEGFQNIMKTKAISFTQKILEGEKVSFFIGGQTGCGKTHICSAILSELAKQGICVHFFNYIQDIATLNRYQYSDKYKETFEELMSLYRNADVLYFDDFMYGTVSESEQKLIFNIINHRYSNALPTIISSEKTVNDIKTINKSIYGRINEMVKQNMINISEDDKKNYREKIV